MVTIVSNEREPQEIPPVAQAEATSLSLPVKNRELDDILKNLERDVIPDRPILRPIRIPGKWLLLLLLLPVLAAGILVSLRHPSGLSVKSITLDHLWTVKTLGPVFGTPAITDMDGDGKNDVMAVSFDGKLYGFDGPSGKRLFWFETSRPLIASPIVVHGPRRTFVVAAGQDNRVYAIGKTGRCEWASIPQSFDVPVLSTPVAVRLNEDVIPDIVVAAEDGRIYAFDGDRGWLIWKTSGTSGKFFSTPLVIRVNADAVPDVIIGSPEGRLYCVDGTDGKKIWETILPAAVNSSAIALDPKTAAIADEQGSLHVFELATGRVKQSVECGGPVVATPLLLRGKSSRFLAIPTKDGRIMALSFPSFETLWTFDSGSQDGFVASPASADLNADRVDDVVASSRNGRAYFLDGTTGRELVPAWFAGNSLSASPVLADINSDGYLDAVLASENGEVTAITIRTVPDRLVRKNRILAGSFPQRGGRNRSDASF
jgi:outer membrane protein assembly factor BamB